MKNQKILIVVGMLCAVGLGGLYVIASGQRPRTASARVFYTIISADEVVLASDDNDANDQKITLMKLRDTDLDAKGVKTKATRINSSTFKAGNTISWIELDYIDQSGKPYKTRSYDLIVNDPKGKKIYP